MFKLHRKVKYALTALKYMQGHKASALVTAKEICAEYDIPFDPTSRVLQIMAQHKMLEAAQGACGGYRLVADLSQYSLYDLSAMIEGDMSVTECSGKAGACDRTESCVLKRSMSKLNDKVLKVFKDFKISEMIK